MSKWLLRGLVFAALMVIIRLLQGAMINAWETKATLISVVLVVVYAVTAFVWGYIDGRADARANPDPDRRADLAMTWLLAGLFAGVVSGAVAWFIGLFYKNLYVEGLLNEITTFAAFTALLTFLFAVVGFILGRWLVDRKTPDQPRQRHGEEDRADTDVFAAVRSGGHDGSGDTGPITTRGGGTERTTPPQHRP
jgi:MFS family permease